jgi:hypothetical protein
MLVGLAAAPPVAARGAVPAECRPVAAVPARVAAFGTVFPRYRLRITTADKDGAGTDANVIVQLIGSTGTTPPVFLDIGGCQDFERGHTDFFDIFAASVGNISMVRLAHDGTKTRPDWLVSAVGVEEPVAGRKWQSFISGDGLWVTRTSPKSVVVGPVLSFTSLFCVLGTFETVESKCGCGWR